MLTWLRKVDYVKLRAYMDDQWRLFRSGIQQVQTSLKANVDMYYKHLREFDAAGMPGHVLRDATAAE